MNLILSDVEETIMIVDQIEGAPEGHTTVNVSLLHADPFNMCNRKPPDREAQNGHAFRSRRWRHISECRILATVLHAHYRHQS